jgi:tetratricopeptide (TPR) repeat protein
MNKAAVEQWFIARDNTPFSLVLVRSDYFNQLKDRLTQTSTDSYRAKYEQAMQQLEQQKKTGKLKEAEYNQKLDELETSYQTQLSNLNNYIDQFARIDLSEVSAEEQRILDMVEEGKIDEAVKAYEALDITGKLRQARENVKAIDEGIEKLEDKRNQELQAIKDLKEKQQREIATLKIAGGKENYDKVAQILKENALADTTDIDAVWEYANFAYNQKDFNEAERFYLIYLNGSKDNLYQQATIQNNLGSLYDDLHDYAKAEEYFLKALEYKTLLFSKTPDAYRADLSVTQTGLGIMYDNLQDYGKAEKYYLYSLENLTYLFNQDPDTYRGDMAKIINNLGVLYYKIHDYAKAEEYYLKALELFTFLHNQAPEKYLADLTSIQLNLGMMYIDIHNFTKSEEYFLKVLESRNYLFSQNPDAYRSDLASIQYNLGLLNYFLNEYAKAEEYYLEALVNFNLLYSQYPDAYREYLVSTLNDLGLLSAQVRNYSKAIEFIDRAITLTPKKADLYDSKGEILLMKGDEQEAVKMWQKVLELDPDFLKKYEGGTELYKQLKEKGLIE